MEEKRRPGRPSQGGPTKSRSIRLGDIYDRAHKLAASRGDNLPDIIERALEDYVNTRTGHSERATTQIDYALGTPEDRAALRDRVRIGHLQLDEGVVGVDADFARRKVAEYTNEPLENIGILGILVSEPDAGDDDHARTEPPRTSIQAHQVEPGMLVDDGSPDGPRVVVTIGISQADDATYRMHDALVSIGYETPDEDDYYGRQYTGGAILYKIEP
jgi:hypothetical protein